MATSSPERVADINALVGDIWGYTLGCDVEPADRALRVEELRLTGFVHIEGDWEGTVTVDCPLPLAIAAAAAMFGTDPWRLHKYEIDDAIGEIANMTGGGIKAMLPGSNRLSLPTVIEGTGFSVNVPGSSVVTDLTYAASGTWMVVRVMQRLDRRHGTGAAATTTCLQRST